MRRVVVTGMGVVSPLGNNLSSSWQALLQGKSGISTYLDDPILKNKQPFNLALIKDFEFSKWKVPVCKFLCSTQPIERIVSCGVQQIRPCNMQILTLPNTI